MCLVFACVVLFITVLWIALGRHLPFETLAYAMFFPGAVAILMSAMHGDIWKFLWDVTGIWKPVDGVVYSTVACVFSASAVGACVLFTLLMGWSKPGPSDSSGVHGHNKRHLAGFVRAAGEEVGWRCFLLPCLMTEYSPCMALIISGIIWGLFHVPVMLLLTYKLQPPRPWLTVLVQSCSCVLAAFPHGWVAVRSGFSLWAPTFMHYSWNYINPTYLGSIYTQTPGKYIGTQWLINGEGLAGCIVLLPFAALVVWDLQ